MNFHDKDLAFAIKFNNSDKERGLRALALEENRKKYGKNVLTEKKKQTLFSKILSALKEPMILILIFGFIIAYGTSLGKFLKSGEGDFAECIGVLLAILLSISITIIMERSSEKAFLALNKIYDNVRVKVVRDGQVIITAQSEIVVGDIIFLKSGDKIVADGRLIESNDLSVDESALTGESNASNKDATVVLTTSSPLAERINCVYSGTFVVSGEGKMIVTAIGDNTEIGRIAGELNKNEEGNSPLQQKLNRLGKVISLIGAITSLVVFLISLAKLFATGNLTFENVQELFVSCIILIVAAVPEGLPTIVAVSLALNMIKLAKENALIKKMTATETCGAVSVICSDKTGTLTQNKMKVMSVCVNEFCSSPEKVVKAPLLQNFVCNSTSDLSGKKGKYNFIGSATECALLEAYADNDKNIDYVSFRESFDVVDRKPFSSVDKYMTTTIKVEDFNRKLIKGAPEVVLRECSLSNGQISKILTDISLQQKKARRVLCFGHYDYKNGESEKKKYVYDGFVAIADPIRKEVYKAVTDCKRAGIKIKILTGDNLVTAFAIAKELKVAEDERQVVTASELEKLDDEALKKLLPKITVIARSTPIVKLRVVRLLKSMGEVVAVTGDGINDAPAIKHADVGIAMGVSGSEITKEAADAVLLDDSFATVVKAVSFGRNVYRNLQRFILFQLTVNLSALFFITVCAIIGLPSPFNTFQLLWINVIMDGPPALTLGLEKAGDGLMKLQPVKRDDGIVNLKMFLRILVSGLFVGTVMVCQYAYNFLNVPLKETKSTVFTLFILFQLFNAFNSRELGSESIFKSIGKNKIMVYTFAIVFLLHLFIVQVCSPLIGMSSMSFSSLVKTIFLSSTIVIASEMFKLTYRLKKALLNFDEKTLKTPL